MLSRRLSLICACTAGPLFLVGCQALRGPEPLGQTFVSPPGPIARSGTVRTVPPTQPQYPAYGQPQYGQPQYGQPSYGQPQYAQPQYGEPQSSQPQYSQPQYSQPQYSQPQSAQPQYSQPQSGQPPALPNAPPQYTPGTQQYAPSSPPPTAPGAQSQYAPGPGPGPSAGQVTLRITGPTQATAGTAASYRFDIANASPTVARSVVLTCQLPANWTYVASSPAGAVSGRQIQWRMNEVGANRTMAIDASFRPDAPGVANVCATIASDGGAALQSCATTRVELPSAPGASKGGPSIPTPAASPLDIAISGPERAAPGDRVTFNVTVTNRGSTKATKLLVTDTFGAGLKHDVATSPIERDLKDLDPGQSDTFKVTFRVAQAGRHCHEVEVTAAGGLRATAQACVVVAGSPRVSVRQAATPTSTTVGGTVRFAIDIKNDGDVDLTGIVVSPKFDRALKPTQATEVRGRQALVNLKDDRYELTPWRFDRLEPGRSIQLDVECRAELASASACGRVTVTSQEGPREEALTCLKIEAGAEGGIGAGAGAAAGPAAQKREASPLTVEVSSSGDPMKVGDEVSYLMTVSNPSDHAIRGVVLQMTMPAGMSAPRAVDANPSQPRHDGRTIAFEPITLRKGEAAKYRVRAKAEQSGEATVDVAVAGDGVSAVGQRKTTTILRP